MNNNPDDIFFPMFTCEICEKDFSTIEELNDHNASKHSPVIQEMEKDLDVLKVLKELTKHLRNLTNDVNQIKTNSVILDKTAINVMKHEIIEEVTNNSDEHNRKLEIRLNKMAQDLDNIKNKVLKSTEEEANDAKKKKEETPSKSLPKKDENIHHPPKETLLVADSIGHNIQLSKVEKAMNTKVKAVKAYGAIKDVTGSRFKLPQRYPQANFTDVIPNELKKDDFECLIIQAGSVDITNLDTKNNANENIDSFKQETIKAATDMFNAATGALNSKTNLKKVVLMTHIPRYDLKQDDPMSLKPVLSQLYNNTIIQLWIHSPLKNKLFIGSHNLDCTGGIKASRYHNIQWGLYDGIHMFGSSGMKIFSSQLR